MGLPEGTDRKKTAREGKKGWWPGQMRGNVWRTWQENKAQRECLVAAAADVVYESLCSVAFDPPK